MKESWREGGEKKECSLRLWGLQTALQSPLSILKTQCNEEGFLASLTSSTSLQSKDCVPSMLLLFSGVICFHTILILDPALSKTQEQSVFGSSY